MPNVLAQITVQLFDNGHADVQVSDSVKANVILGYGLLGLARDAIKDINKQEAAKIVPPTDAERFALSARERLNGK